MSLKKFNNRPLSDISNIDKCPEIQFTDYDSLRHIDVLWFREKGIHLIPENAFEIELTTGIWSGVGRLATLLEYANVKLYVISNDNRKFDQIMNSFLESKKRYKFVPLDQIGDLYSAELNLKKLRYKIGI